MDERPDGRHGRPVGPRRPGGNREREPEGNINWDLDLAELDRRRRSKRPGERSRMRKALRIFAGITAVGVLVTAGLGTYLYEHLFGNIWTVSLSGLTNRPAAASPNAAGQTPENILVLGSQTRDGQTGVNLGNSTKLGTDLSDTAMLFHLSADRKWAVVVSIPRDLVVARPQCTSRFNQSVIIPSEDVALADATDNDMYDAAMNLGGPVCAVATTEQLTGLRVDHFVEVTFNAFQQMTDAVGGVKVCIPEPGINDPDYSGLVLSAGEHVISGTQALEFIRDRHGVGNGTDLGRIQYQQMFVSSLFGKLTSNGTLANPLTLYNIANAVTSNLTVDSGLDSLTTMVSLAESINSIKSKYIQLITAPYDFDPDNQNRVVPGTGFNAVWTDLRNDQPLPDSPAAAEFGTTSSSDGGAGSGSNGGSGASPSASPSGPPLASLAVTVYNGTDISHLASDAAANLSALGVQTTVGENGFSGYETSEILYPAGQQDQAQTLATQVAGAVVKESDAASSLTLILGRNVPSNLTAPIAAATGGAGDPDATIGPDSANVADVTPDPNPTISAESRTGDQDLCSALPTPNAFGGSP